MTKTYMKLFPDFIKSTGKIILDIGSGTPKGKYLRHFNENLKKKFYISLEIDSTQHPDVVGDIHNLPFKECVVDGVICHAVLEHVTNPFIAVSELHRVLKQKGTAFVFVPFLANWHGYSFPDNWRFTLGGVKILFKDFKNVRSYPHGGFCSMLNHVTGLYRIWGGEVSIFYWLDRFLGIFRKKAIDNNVRGYYVIGDKG